MSPEISEHRRRRLLDRERKPQADRPPFRSSGWLTAIYRSLFFLLSASLLAFAEKGTAPSDPSRCLVIFISVGFCLVIFHGAMRSLYKPTAHRNTHICLLHTTVLLSLLLGFGLCHATAPLAGHSTIVRAYQTSLPFALPHFLAPTLLTLLLGPVAGTIGGIGQCLVLTLLLGLRISSDGNAAMVRAALLSCFAVGFLCATFVPQLLSRPGSIRRRSRIVLAAAKTTLPVLGIAAAVLATQYATGTLPYPDGVLWPAACPFALLLVSFLLQAVLVALLLPVLEHVFAQTSDITLQNFADLANPLLERLSLEAPGTYNHSIMVATLAAAACEKVGANPLLARVGAYYHDIGKLAKPSFFTENIQAGKNPHETLSPGTSAALIRSHVKDGIILAERYHLPLPVRQIIEEHHGTTVMAYFLNKAKAAALDEAEKNGDRTPAEVPEGTFRYPGPRPSSRESGILLLADSVEAATRSLEHATPSAIDSKVAEIINSKLLDGQFDDCPLTLGDIAEIRKTFTTSLLSILHKRIAYPDVDELREKPAAGEETPPDTLSTPPARSAP